MSKATDLPYRPCAGVMLLNSQRRVFVGQRMDSSSEAWQMPQGGIDKGEDAETAAFRELEEETGIASSKASLVAKASRELVYDLPDELVGKIWKGRYRGQRQSWFLMRFDGSDSDVNIATQHQEFRAWKWAQPATLPDLIVPFKKRLYEELLLEFGSHLKL
ncbi:RNA pyrophosphohydrolase [Parasphingopyxis lamellibrachiae]|uniref:RNA pyrophosphohydrolase n=1 Tax=Parasphingopyxis lamellibrachiae TaxID=680125 RepID=A0A3D9FDJ6_9SPHN|nr:RNA pyrophosphohydrolase [Parasphingopyxis lamellibrachiae]RED15738.1 putative (di)nucleoside polyphosphate hydrolase [Parasphingopyxis lamellibrachiae]